MPNLNFLVTANVQQAVQGLQQVAQIAASLTTSAASITPAVNTASQALAQSAVASAAAAGGMQQVSQSAVAAQAAYASIANTAAAFTQKTAAIAQSAQAQANGARAIANGFSIVGVAAQQTNTPLTSFGRLLQNTSGAASGLGGSMKGTSAGVGQANIALTGFNRVLQDLPFGFVAIQNNLTELPNAFRGLSAAAKETGVSMGSLLLKALTGAGGIGFALSAVTAAATFATVGFTAWSRILGGTKKNADENKKSHDELAESIKRATDAAANEFANVSKFVSEAFDARNQTLEKQVKLLQDLKNANGAYFGDLKIENGLITGLTDAYAKYADNIFKVAKAKGAEDQIKTLSEQLVGVTGKLNDANAAFQVNTSTFGRIAAIGAKNIDDLFKAGDKVNEVLNKTIPTFEDIQFLSKATGLNETDINNKLLVRQKLRTEELRIVGQIGELSKFVSAQEGSTVDNLTPKKAKIDQIAETLRKLAIDRDELAKNPLLSFDEKDNKDFELLNSAITRLRELKVDKNNPIVIGLRSELSDDAIQVALDKFRERLKKTGTIDPVQIPIELSTNLVKDHQDSGMVKIINSELEQLDKFTGAARKKLNTLLFDPKKFKEQVETFADTAKKESEIIAGTFTNMFEAFGEGLANKNLFGGMAQALGEGLKTLGKFMIESSTLIASIKKALNAAFAANPIAGIGLGIGLITLGSLIEKSLPKFAEGGIAYGPTVGLFGEYPGAANNPEVVAPLSKLKSMLGDTGGVQAVVVTGQITGNNINLANSRTQNTRRRLYGK
jgi:hypothetical protein